MSEIIANYASKAPSVSASIRDCPNYHKHRAASR